MEIGRTTPARLPGASQASCPLSPGRARSVPSIGLQVEPRKTRPPPPFRWPWQAPMPEEVDDPPVPREPSSAADGRFEHGRSGVGGPREWAQMSEEPRGHGRQAPASADGLPISPTLPVKGSRSVETSSLGWWCLSDCPHARVSFRML